MKLGLNIIGILLLIMGTIWILQGTGVFPVGFMANNMKYTYMGIVVDAVGIVLLVLANRKKRPNPPMQ